MVRFVLLRGLGREARHWGDLPARLGPGTVCLDLPGAGDEVGASSPASVAGIVEHVRGRFRHIGEPGWALAGISLGGMVAMTWVAHYPRDFAGVALINTSAGNVAPFWERMRPGVLPAVLASLAGGDAAARERRILGVTTTRLTPERRREVAAGWADARITRRAALAQIVAGARFRAPASLPVPALVLASGGDGLCASSCGARLAARFGAPFRLHPDAGHDLATDAPAWTARALSDWAVTLEEDGARGGRT